MSLPTPSLKPLGCLRPTLRPARRTTRTHCTTPTPTSSISWRVWRPNSACWSPTTTRSLFADRYGFRVVGSVIPAATTAAEASIARLEELAHVIEHEGVEAIFGDSTHASATLEELASQAGVMVVSLNTDSLGPARSAHSTYIGLLTSNAEAIVSALQSGG